MGRAVTCTFMPIRPDLANVVRNQGEKNGWEGFFNQWVVDNLGNGDGCGCGHVLIKSIMVLL